MKYSININQKAIVDLGLQDKVDFIDLVIYDFITDFMLCDDCSKMQIGGVQYFWIKADLIIDNLPLLGITTTRGINKRIDKLVECKLLERCNDNQNLHQSFFKVGENYNAYKFFTWNENSKGAWNENSKNNNNNNKIDNKEKEIDKSISKKTNNFGLDMSFVDKTFLPIILEWLEYKKEKKQSYKQRGFNTLYKNLLEMCNGNVDVARKIVNQSMQNNYAGLFPLKQATKYTQQSLPVGMIIAETQEERNEKFKNEKGW